MGSRLKTEICMINLEIIKNAITNNINILAIILSPVVAVVVGELLRKRNYEKGQRDTLVKRILSYGYQMTPVHKEKDEILSALNEIKYWYSTNTQINKTLFEVLDKMEKGEDSQEIFIKLVQMIGKKEGHILSKNDVVKVFSLK